MTRPVSRLAPADLATGLAGARSELDALAAKLRHDDWLGPYATHLNPPLWEYGHIVWFQELWCLRVRAGVDPDASPLLEPLRAARIRWADWLYNSSRIPHPARWRAPLPSVEETRAYGAEVLTAVTAKLAGDPAPDDLYYAELALQHERMHIEAWWMMWQWRSLPPPHVPQLPSFDGGGAFSIDAGTVTLGSPRDAGFVFDNEKWAHEVAYREFEIDRRPVTNREFAEFVDAGGYSRAELWSDAGREWLTATGARHPIYWRRERRGWQLRRFDRWLMPEREPAIHVSRFEAEAYAAWRGRRLPTAAEWVRGSREAPFALGRCWEWTATEFGPYPGFSADPYADYSVPSFKGHAELRGAGSWVTAPALARPTYRNFYTPDRRDPFVGFRTAKSR
jgi:ergothioneine biosynthesis protein EgtB